MSVALIDGRVVLAGVCGIDDADALYALLSERGNRVVDLSAATTLHTALWQLLMALRPPLSGVPTDPFSARSILPALAQSDIS